MAEMKKIPVVLQNGEETPITTANAYRMQHRAMLEAFGISSMEQFENLDPELKKSIPFFPEYAEVGQSRAGSAMAMMRALTDAAIMQRLNHVAELVANIPSKMDFNNLTAFIENFSNSHVEFVTAFKEFIASEKHNEPLTTTLEAKAEGTFDPEASKLMGDLKIHTGEISALANELHNLTDELYERAADLSYMDDCDDDDYDMPKAVPSNKSACPKIIIKGHNYGHISIGDYNMTDDADDDTGKEEKDPYVAASAAGLMRRIGANAHDYGCRRCDYDENDEDDYGADDEVSGPFAGTGCEPASVPIPVGIVDDAKLAAYLFYAGTMNPTPLPGVPFSIFHTKSLEKTLSKRYPNAAIMKLGDDGRTSTALRIFRSEYVWILMENLSAVNLYHVLTSQIATAMVLEIREARESNGNVRAAETMAAIRINRMIEETLCDVDGLRNYLADDENLCQICKEPDDLLLGYLDRDESMEDCRVINDQIDGAGTINEKFELTSAITDICSTNIFAPEFADRCKELIEKTDSVLRSADQIRSIGILAASVIHPNWGSIYDTIYKYARAEFLRYVRERDKSGSPVLVGDSGIIDVWDAMTAKAHDIENFNNIFRPSYVKKLREAISNAIAEAYTSVMVDIQNEQDFEPDCNPEQEVGTSKSRPDSENDSEDTDHEG